MLAECGHSVFSRWRILLFIERKRESKNSKTKTWKKTISHFVCFRFVFSFCKY